jgi:predicted DNA binding protein/putative methionine-R-sulfoxide reductase with GAF domain
MLLYDSHDQQWASVAPFIRDGLEAGDQCVYFAHDNTEDEVVTALRERGIDADAALDTGQLELHRATDVYLADCSFDPDGMIDRLEGKMSRAEETEYDRLRLVGEMTWAAEHDIDPTLLQAYERKVDEFYRSESLIGLCQYRRSRFSSESLDTLLESHPRVLHDEESRLNCYYGASADRDETSDSAVLLDRKLQTISAQRHISESLEEREECLSLLGQATEQLQDVAPGDVERIAADIIGQIVDPSLISCWRYDDETGQLRAQVLQNTFPEVEADPVLDELSDRAWNAFVENEPKEFSSVDDPPVSGAVLPAGQHGIFLVGTRDTGGIPETDLDFISAVVSHTETVLDQGTYKRRLEEKNEQLREQNAKLERVNRINGVIREINKSLVDATTEEEVAKAVCELIVDEACVDFAWFGTYEPATGTVSPAQHAGDVQSYLDAITFDEDWASNEPAARVARSRESAIVERVYDEPPLEKWQDLALKRGFQSVVSLPVSFDDSMYGVLSLYSDTPGTFDDEIVSVLDELSDCMAYAVNSIKRKQALVTEAVTEIEIRVSDIGTPIVEFVSEHECRVDVDEITSAYDGGFRVFITFHNVSPEEIRSFAVASPSIEAIEILSKSENAFACECKAADTSMTANLLNHNAVPQSIKVEDGEAHLVLHLPRDERVRSFMEMFRTKYPSTEIVSRRNYDQPLRRISDIESRLGDDLTDRQLETLKMAYHSGYFERPRQRTAEDIADALDVTSPTVSRHLREAERRVFSLLFDESHREGE